MEGPIVEIGDGKLRGTFSKNYKGEKTFEFLGIPYGKPPIGKLRFRVSIHSQILC